MRRSQARIVRRAALLVGAAALGVGGAWLITGDIGEAWRSGTIAPATPAQAYEPAPAANTTDEFADSTGFAMAAQMRVRRDAECGRMQPQFRRGCRDYLRHEAEGRSLP